MPLPALLLEPVKLARPLSPAEILAALPAGPGRLLLESGLSGLSRAGAEGAPAPGAARWSFAAAEPVEILQGRCDGFGPWQPGGSRGRARDPFALLDRAVARMWGEIPASLPSQRPPFVGGAAGFLAYDLNRLVERLPRLARPEVPVPDFYLGVYDLVAALDHQDGSLWLAGILRPGRERAALERARRWQAALELAAERRPLRAPPPAPAGPLVSNFSPPAYTGAVARALRYIHDGEVFQVNLAQRFRTVLSPSWGTLPGWKLYLRQREANPAPFAAYLHGSGFEIVSASPERLLRVEPLPGGARRAEMRPIKGTRPRGRTPAEDRALAQELLDSDKDRAELTMIVDLCRNDLGRVARWGSVRVPSLRRLESFPTVHHTVATVDGLLRPHVTPGGLLRAVFPGGSVTGAPKVRAMEIIEELEGVRRHVYCGSIGYFSWSGHVDLNIAIRTVTVAAGRALFHAGGGIVADSDLLFLATGGKATVSHEAVHGAPDLVVAVLSSATKARDLGAKLRLYARFGVQFYWVVDPEERTLRSFRLREGGYEEEPTPAAGHAFTCPLFPTVPVDLSHVFSTP